MPSLQTSDVIATAAGVVAFFAMVATLWQAKIARDHNRLSVMPHLDASFMAFPDQPFRIVIFNSGLGPAMVRSFSITVDDIEYTHGHPKLSADLNEILGRSGMSFNLTVFGSGTPIRADSEVEIVKTHAPAKNLQEFEAMKAFGRRLGLRVVYASFYGDARELRISFAEFG